MTPAMQQYYDIKDQYKDSLLFFRMGDFYEMFGEDAQIAHKVLGIQITTRNKNATDPIPLAGIPYHAKEKYLPTLVKAGYKVAIAEQVSDPNLKGIVNREVVRVVSPATLGLEGENYQEARDSNFIASLIEKNGKYAASFIDLSSNKRSCSEFIDFDSLKGELYKLSPKEVILDKNLFDNEEVREVLTKKYSLNIYFFEPKENGFENLTSHFKTTNLSGFGIEDKLLAIDASSLLLEYLETNQKSDFSFLNCISYQSFTNYLDLDESTIRNLDLIYNFQTKSSSIGTIFGVLNKSKTPMGTRYLREQIVKPLINKGDIEGRHIFIEELLKDKILLDNIIKKLTGVSDIDLILNRLALGRALPRDLLNLKKSLISIVEVYEIIKQSDNKKLNKLI